MKGRISATLWWVFGINAVVLAAVLCLSYGAGARSGGLSLRDFTILPPIAGFELLGGAFLVVVASGALFIWLDTKIRKPLTELVEFSDNVIAGNREAMLDVRPDDFGLVVENWHKAVELLANSAEIQATSEALQRDLAEFEKALAQLGRGEFNARARTSTDVLAGTAQGFNAAAEATGRRLDRVRVVAGDLSAAIQLSAVAAREAASAMAEAEQQTMALLPSADQVAAGVRQVRSDADSATDASRRALEFADHGNRAVRDAADGMQRIRSSMQATAAKIKSLGDRSLEIYEIINIIHETNLLALNAVVETSRGGGAQPLDTLAGELRKLADYSRSATRDIVSLLKSIQAESNEAVVVMEQANRVAETGVRLTEQASKAFAGIATLLRQTAELAQAISARSRQQVEGTETVRGSVQALGERARQDALGGQQAARNADQVTRLCAQLNEALAQFRTGPAVVKSEKAEVVSTAAAGCA